MALSNDFRDLQSLETVITHAHTIEKGPPPSYLSEEESNANPAFKKLLNLGYGIRLNHPSRNKRALLRTRQVPAAIQLSWRVWSHGVIWWSVVVSHRAELEGAVKGILA